MGKRKLGTDFEQYFKTNPYDECVIILFKLSIISSLFHRRSYYLIVALTSEGHLNFEEDREGQTYGVRLDKNFLNGARHSVYYTRVNNSATLLVNEIYLQTFAFWNI